MFYSTRKRYIHCGSKSITLHLGRNTSLQKMFQSAHFLLARARTRRPMQLRIRLCRFVQDHRQPHSRLRQTFLDDRCCRVLIGLSRGFV